MLDDLRDSAARRRPAALPVLCQDVLLLRAGTTCPKCSGRTAAFALMGLPEFETDGQDAALLRRVPALPAALDKAVRDFAGSLWRVDVSRAVKGAHWHSHCERCGARLGEVFLHGPAGPFRPRLYKDRAAIRAKQVAGPFVFDGAMAVRNPAMLEWLDWYRQREAKQQAADRPKRAPKAVRKKAPAKTATPKKAAAKKATPEKA